jgi:hypothetical protein
MKTQTQISENATSLLQSKPKSSFSSIYNKNENPASLLQLKLKN